MPDLLVKLYDLPELEPAIARQRTQGVTIRRGIAPEKHLVLPWIRRHFSEYWVSEADVGFASLPTTIMLAHRGDQLLGFACYDTTHKNFFGPTGVDEAGAWPRHRHCAAACHLARHACSGLYVRDHRLGRSGRVL